MQSDVTAAHTEMHTTASLTSESGLSQHWREREGRDGKRKEAWEGGERQWEAEDGQEKRGRRMKRLVEEREMLEKLEGKRK